MQPFTPPIIMKEEVCRDCKFPVVMVILSDYQRHPQFKLDQGKFADQEYWFYCSNPACPNHGNGGSFADNVMPDWVVDSDDEERGGL